ncbi:MAG: TonB-dependent receptor [Pseudomonadota bacterium]
MKYSVSKIALLVFFVAPNAALATELAQATEISQNPGVSTSANGALVYLPTFFAQFSPDTAADMVRQVPGFAIQEGDEVRGLAGSAGNVLIDGSRPSSKDQSLRNFLDTIPAASVERIELLQGAAIGSLGGGHASLINVVRKTSATNSTSVTLAGSLRHHNIIIPEINLTHNGNFHGYNYSVKLDAGYGDRTKRFGGEGLVDNQGNITQFGPNYDYENVKYGRIILGLDGNIGRTKSKFDFTFLQYHEQRPWHNIITLTGQNSPFRVDSGHDDGKGPDISFGARFERPIFGYEGKLNLILRRENDNDFYDAGFNLVGQPATFTRFASNSVTDEFAGQLEFARVFGNHSISFGGETGLTRLDNEGNFYENTGAGFILDPSSNSRTQVQEIRSEAFIADTWAINPTLSLEGKLRTEWSRISQEDANANERSYVYLKPRLAINYRPSPQWIVNASIEKVLGQLDFSDFAFSVNLSEGNQNQGNAELRPDQTTQTTLSVERKWGTRGTLKISWLNQDITDALTTIPVFENGQIVGEATGNIPIAHRHGFDYSLTLPLDNLLPGLEFKSDWRYRISKLIDPITNRPRENNGQGERNFEAQIAYNNEERKYSMSAFYNRGDRGVQFNRFSSYLWPPASFWGIDGEYKGIKDLTISASLELPNGLRIRRFRTDYLVSRADGQTNGGHFRYRDLKPAFSISIRKAL